MRVLLVIAAALAVSGCPRTDSTPIESGGNGTGSNVQGSGQTADAGPADDTTDPVTGTGVPPGGVPCDRQACVFHAGTGAYFLCLNGASGNCFHFGASCAPESGCMFDPAARRYRACTDASEGRCRAWGADCAPDSRCMFNPADALYHLCEQVDGGACARYGALCDP